MKKMLAQFLSKLLKETLILVMEELIQWLKDEFNKPEEDEKDEVQN